VCAAESSVFERYRSRIENATNDWDVWGVVKDTVEFVFHRRPDTIMPSLDDVPARCVPVPNRASFQIVEAGAEAKRVVNALTYNRLVHNYLHALGEVSGVRVMGAIVEVARKCFGEDHIVTQVARAQANQTPFLFSKTNCPVSFILNRNRWNQLTLRAASEKIFHKRP
jgi:hypothetical protein